MCFQDIELKRQLNREGIPYLLEALYYQIDYWNFIGSNLNEGCLWYSTHKQPQGKYWHWHKEVHNMSIDTTKEPTSSEKGRKWILEAATIRKDIVDKRLRTVAMNLSVTTWTIIVIRHMSSDVSQQALKGFSCTTRSSWAISWNLEA